MAAAKKRNGQGEPALGGRGGLGWIEAITENGVFKFFILACIIANSAALGYNAHFGDDNRYQGLIQRLDDYFLWIFTAELALEFLAQGPRRWVRGGWNWFDFFIVAISYASSIPGVTALRTFRVFRVFRLISNVPQMRRVVEALIGALPGIVATVMVLAVVFYIGAVMATMFFRGEEGFNNLGESAISLFALANFDGFGDTIVRLDHHHPFAWAFIIGFTVLAAFAVLNLFIGVIVDAVQETRDVKTQEIAENVEEIEEDVEDIQEAQEDAAVLQRRILDELSALRAEVAALRAASTK
jgi:voltage-gated sodium channel